MGCRKAKSCVDNLAQTSIDLQRAIEEDNYISVLVMDIRNAYDNVQVDVLLDRLIRKGPRGLLTFIHLLLSERIIYCKYGSFDEVLYCYRGQTQGGVLSSILYNCYTLDLDQKKLDNTTILQFADDVALYAKTQDVEDELTFVEQTANDTGKYLEESGLSLVPEKCNLIVFSRNKNMRKKDWNIQMK